MFLVVFVTLVISILGLFAQVASLQAQKMSAAQVGLMQTMVAWHNAAVTLAMNHLAAVAAVTATGCNMTTTGTSVTTSVGTLAPCGTAIQMGSASLPTGYVKSPYSFYSAAFQSGSTNYVITFVKAPTGTNNLQLPAGATTDVEVGYTLGDLQRQFAHAASINVSYGSVTASGTLSVLTKGGTTFSYSIPTTIPTGSFGIISPAQ